MMQGRPSYTINVCWSLAYICEMIIDNYFCSNLTNAIDVQDIGAEHGEGFETFRSCGPLQVDVVRPVYIASN